MAIKNLIQLRKGSASEWASTNPVLASGEPGYDITNNIIKIGDGTSSWNSLSALSIDLDTSLVAGTGIALSYNSSNNSLSINITGNYASIAHNHTVSDISNFASGVSGLLPITNIAGGNNVSVSSSGSTFTVSVTGQLGLDAEQVDDRVSQLLVGGYGINLNYDDNANSLTLSSSGLQPSGSYANSIHSHNVSDITNFNSGVSGLLPVTNITAGTGINVISSSTNFTITNNSPIINYTSSTSFPTSGISGYYYLDSDTGRLYQWTGSYYAEIGPPISNVNNAQNAANLYLWSNFK